MAGREFLRWLGANWQLKLLSLLAAAGLWVLAVSGQNAQTTLTVPLEFRSIPSGLEVVGEAPESVEVQVWGLRTMLGRLTGADFRAEVDLAGAAAGERLVPLLPEHVRAPKGIKVLRVKPSRIHLVLRRSGTAMLPVIPAPPDPPRVRVRAELP